MKQADNQNGGSGNGKREMVLMQPMLRLHSIGSESGLFGGFFSAILVSYLRRTTLGASSGQVSPWSDQTTDTHGCQHSTVRRGLMVRYIPKSWQLHLSSKAAVTCQHGKDLFSLSLIFGRCCMCRLVVSEMQGGRTWNDRGGRKG